MNIYSMKEKELSIKETTLDRLYSFLDSLPNPISFIPIKRNQKTNSPKPESERQVQDEEIRSTSSVDRNYWLNFISSNAFILVVMVIVPFTVSYKVREVWVILIAYFVIFGILLIGCFLVAYFFSLIPVINGMAWINYIINFIVQLLLWMIFGLFLSRFQKKVS